MVSTKSWSERHVDRELARRQQRRHDRGTLANEHSKQKPQTKCQHQRENKKSIKTPQESPEHHRARREIMKPRVDRSAVPWDSLINPKPRREDLKPAAAIRNSNRPRSLFRRDSVDLALWSQEFWPCNVTRDSDPRLDGPNPTDQSYALAVRVLPSLAVDKARRTIGAWTLINTSPRIRTTSRSHEAFA
ncbi:hypothetical protein R1flu_013461 [Riccia fluitans]|uniref:Uncharacterized protein n=1 Tax=Riccia fluitans TaxID=41844 RepID=A0ABD1YDL6_9MARC